MAKPIKAGKPNVSFIRPEVSALLPLYSLIRDCLAGEPTIKAGGTKYLPMPNAQDTSKENKERYAAYLLRAVFYNVTRRTLSGLVGQVFMRDPVIELPDAMQIINEDATGTGIDLTQESKKSVAMTLAYSRSGLFVDYPQTPEGGVTQEELEKGNIRPTINSYSPMQIINWRTIERGAKEVLSLIVLAESYVGLDDGFEIKNCLQFRVLRLDDAGNYLQDIYREINSTTPYDEQKGFPRNANFDLYQTITPTDPQGKPFDEIPFIFIGSENNDPLPDHPNMYDLASINVAHYRNSADYEESCYIVGQPTVVMTGLTEEWVKNVLNGVVTFGSRGGLPLPVGGDAKIINAEENTMIKEAIEHKELQMVALGAKLVEQKSVQRTAFEAKVDATASSSTLASSARNVSMAYQWALEWAAIFMNVSGEIKFELNQDFDIARMTPEERAQALKDWQAGAITFGEMRTAMRKAGIATEDDDVAKEEIANDQVASMRLEQPFNTPDGKPVPPNQKPPEGKPPVPPKK